MADSLTPITSFRDEHRFLSNFWPAPVLYEGILFPTVEHAYVAAKTLDLDQRRAIAEKAQPGAAKRAGRKLVLRPDWDEVRLPTMRALLEQKFQIVELRRLLQATEGRELIEGNAWGDTFWGVCGGVGENHLGKILMQIRDSFPADNQGNLR